MIDITDNKSDPKWQIIGSQPKEPIITSKDGFFGGKFLGMTTSNKQIFDIFFLQSLNLNMVCLDEGFLLLSILTTFQKKKGYK